MTVELGLHNPLDVAAGEESEMALGQAGVGGST